MKRMALAGFMGLVLCLGQAGPASTALASADASPLAAGMSLYIDDDPANNGATTCPVTPYTNLQAAVAALGVVKTNVTLTMCPGIYDASENKVVFDGYTNLKLIGKGGPAIGESGFTGTQIAVVNSTKVTVSGLYISGVGALGSATATAIQFYNSSGIIKGNLITDWHQNFYAPLTDFGTAIMVISTDTSHTVTIDKNTIFDVQDHGILARGPAVVKITKNRIVMHSDIEVTQAYFPAPVVQSGIFLLGVGDGTQVTSNVIESNAGMSPYPCTGVCLVPSYATRGVLVVQTSRAKITGNKLSQLLYGISIESWCFDSPSSDAHADENLVSKNKFYNNQTGILVRAQNYFGFACTPSADDNIITSNTFDRNSSIAGGALRFTAALPATAAGNKATGNTFNGYMLSPLNTAYQEVGTGVSGSVFSPNKVSMMPLTGPLP